MLTGAANDLANATESARSMVARFRMDQALGQVSYEPETAPLLGVLGGADYGEETAAAIHTAVRGLEKSAKNLLVKETFSADERIPYWLAHPRQYA